MEQLRAVYSDLLSQPVPQHLIKIIERLPQPNPHARSETMGRSTDMRSVALVVDDNADERSLAAAILEETDLRVVEASSGEQALDYLRTRAGEVVFLFTATRLPCLMSGVDLARNVQSNWPWIRVIVTSGASLGQDELSELPRE